MKAVVTAFNQEKALVGAFSVITNLRMKLFEALVFAQVSRVPSCCLLLAPARELISLYFSVPLGRTQTPAAPTNIFMSSQKF